MAIINDRLNASPSNNLGGIVRSCIKFVKNVSGWITGARRWHSIAIMLALLMGISAIAVLLGIAVTPAKGVDTLGQHFTVSAAPPNLSFVGHGEITINTGHPQTFDLLPSRYYGPARAHLTVDAPFQGSDELNKAAIEHRLPPQVGSQFAQGFRAWLEIFALITLAVGFALGVIIAFGLLLKNGNRRQACMLVVRCFVATLLNLLIVTSLFVAGSSGIGRATSLDGLVGHSTLHLSPQPMGPKLTGYDGVSIGDSRAATQGGKGIKNPSQDDGDCQRSSDSLAAQIGQLEGWRVLNLACSAATIPQGLMGEQSRGGRYLIPQISAVEQMTNIKAVFVTIGPNDLWWSRAIGLCYMADVCNDNLTGTDYQALLEQFKWNYHDLLVELQGLRNGPNGTRPLIVINGSYDVISDTATCPDAKGLTKDKIDMLSQRNADLNRVLQEGATLFGFTFVKPKLELRCQDLASSPGPDIRSPKDPNAFHPTDIGVGIIAAQDAMALAGATNGASTP